jgi:hypothetical protein
MAVALIAVAACGGDDDNKSSATAKPSGTSAAQGSSTSAASQTSGAQATDTPSGTDDVLGQLEALGQNFEKRTGKVTYQSTETDGSTSTITFYSKDDKSRFDSTDSSGSTGIFIETATASYSCDPSEQVCIQYGQGGGSGIGAGFAAIFSPQYIDALVAAAQSEGIDVTKSSDNIAGQDVDCYSGTGPDGSGKFCFNGDGLMVYTEFQDSTGTTKMQATEVTSDVSDSDFDPPYPVTTIPAIPT